MHYYPPDQNGVIMTTQAISTYSATHAALNSARATAETILKRVVELDSKSVADRRARGPQRRRVFGEWRRKNSKFPMELLYTQA